MARRLSIIDSIVTTVSRRLDWGACMGVGPGPSKVADVEIHVFGRVVSPEWFCVKASRRISKTGWEADVRIVDRGHAITWGSGSSRLTEVFVGPEVILPQAGLLYHSRVKRERSKKLTPDRHMEYQTCFEAEKLDAEIFAHLTEELTLVSAKSDLFHRFARANRMAPAPVSRLHIEARGKGLSVQSFHTFPDECTIVRVQSLFEVM